MNKKLITTLVSGISITLGTLTLNMPSSNARPSSHTFACANVQGTPATVARRGTEQVTMIRWSKNDGYFGDGWTPQKRCEHVSTKFQEYAQQGNLRYITHGVKNGYPIICVAKTEGGNCVWQLFTLRKSDNPRQKVSRLLDRNSISSNPLAESDASYIINVNDKVYIDLNVYLGVEEDVTSESGENTNNSVNEESTSPTVNNSETNQEKNVWFFE
ncbi:COP23 domain-containing protein [Geminocystis herdmanii]|uniref:COP23 domain-containing protein n=1 Tax=Geminocystis herdmanii TaxID=669359 RepID=UPI000347EF96|nr:COP23 domain-containing protein [Geminocystis herdmanii]